MALEGPESPTCWPRRINRTFATSRGAHGAACTRVIVMSSGMAPDRLAVPMEQRTRGPHVLGRRVVEQKGEPGMAVAPAWLLRSALMNTNRRDAQPDRPELQRIGPRILEHCGLIAVGSVFPSSVAALRSAGRSDTSGRGVAHPATTTDDRDPRVPHDRFCLSLQVRTVPPRSSAGISQDRQRQSRTLARPKTSRSTSARSGLAGDPLLRALLVLRIVRGGTTALPRG